MDGPPSASGRPRRRRLARSAEFERVYRQGRSKANRFLVLYAFPREGGTALEDDGPRLGLSVSRRVGGAPPGRAGGGARGGAGRGRGGGGGGGRGAAGGGAPPPLPLGADYVVVA